MKNIQIAIFFFLLIVSFCVDVPINARTLAFPQFDKTTMIKKKINDAQKHIESGEYETAKSSIYSLLKLDPSNSKAKELLTECEEAIIRQKEDEKTEYLNVCKAGTVSALQSFVTKYPNSEYIAEVNNRIQDYEIWLTAQTKNTIEGYQSYLHDSNVLAYKEEAIVAIRSITEDQEWIKCKDSNSESKLADFIRNFPESVNVKDAQYRLNIIKGENYYKDGNTTQAYLCLDDANSYSHLDGTTLQHYNELLDLRKYKEIETSSDKAEVRQFLNTSPNSPYYDEASNHYALLLAKDFSLYSSDYNYNEALSYAKDEYTRSTVKYYIEKSKKAYSRYKRQERYNRIIANGGYVLLGIELLDYGWNGISPDRYLNVGYYNVGLSVKFGNYRSPIQFEIGIKPGVILFKDEENNDESYYDDDYEMTTKFHLPIYAKLKINICNSGNNCKFYIAGLGFYNAIRENYLENEYSAGCGVGFAGKHWDWLLYYKQDVENKYSLDDKFLGTSVVYYF